MTEQVLVRDEASTIGTYYDVIVVGAGFAGLYSVYCMQEIGCSVRALEAGDGLGGTWFWNRYPGARCDIESVQYSYSFSEEIQQEWSWSERYAPQPEILRYMNFVADRLGLRKQLQFNTRVVSATFDEGRSLWTIVTEKGECFCCRFCVMATGCLSIPIDPAIKGLDIFKGKIYRTMEWPAEGVEFSGLKVGLIGTGATGVQITPHLAVQAKHLAVFQRTANFSIPGHNRPMGAEYEREWKENYRERRIAARGTRNNALMRQNGFPGESLSDEELDRIFEERWQMGGLAFLYAATDFVTSKRVNDAAAEFVRRKIAGIVKDPEMARKLMPRDHPIGSKRLCVDTHYYETFNRDNVTLIDLKEEPIETLTETGVRTTKGDYRLDAIVLATGFDAMTGSLRKIDITGRNGMKLADKWNEAPKTLLGLAIAGFPNMFTITGPGSPSVFSNMVTSIEQSVDWIADCVDFVRKHGMNSVEAKQSAEDQWFFHV
ncbi:flavin-containing monooxygenase, partial [Pseudorhodoplanes sp.]|uniref:flavin-containing monooxygenase n=1 Tax=Pseudorhodoplanes sp. TaxID=1934341 RepID=UPI003D13214A